MPDTVRFCPVCGQPAQPAAPQYQQPAPQVQQPQQQFQPQPQPQYQQPAQSYQQPQPQYQQQYQQPQTPYGQPYYPAQQKKSRTGLIVGLTSAVAVLAIAAVLLFVFVFNGGSDGLNGTYVSVDDSSVSVSFSGSNKMSMNAYGMEFSGTYKINGDTLTFTMDILGFTQDQDMSYRKDGNTIYLDGDELRKK